MHLSRIFLILLFLLSGFSLKAQLGDLNIYPNPFSDSATIRFHVGKPDSFFLALYDKQGHTRMVFVDSTVLDTGIHRYIIPGDSLAEGLYTLKVALGGDMTMGIVKVNRSSGIQPLAAEKPYRLLHTIAGQYRLEAGQPIVGVQLVDLQGRIVNTYTPQVSEFTLPASVPPGIYVLQFSLKGGETYIERVVKEFY